MLLQLLAIAAAQPEDSPKPVPLNPEQWVLNTDYPDAAIRAREQGTVAFSLQVDSDGRVAGCTITQSAQSAILDSETCRLLMTRGRFKPARDINGHPVHSAYQGRFRWVLPDRAFTPPRGMTVTTVEVSADGSVEKCSTETTGQVPPLIQARACKELDQPMAKTLLGKYAPLFQVLRLAFSVSDDPYKAKVDGSSWGELLVRRTSEVQVAADGTLIRCNPKASVGEGLSDQFCASVERAINRRISPGKEPAYLISVDHAVFGTRR